FIVDVRAHGDGLRGMDQLRRGTRTLAADRSQRHLPAALGFHSADEAVAAGQEGCRRRRRYAQLTDPQALDALCRPAEERGLFAWRVIRGEAFERVPQRSVIRAEAVDREV